MGFLQLAATQKTDEIEASRPIKIMIAGRKESFAAAVSQVIGSQPDFDVVGVASDELSVSAYAGDLKPDVVLLGLNMLQQSGQHIIAGIKRDSPKTKILVWGSPAMAASFSQPDGVDGFVAIEILCPALTRAVRSVAGCDMPDIQAPPADRAPRFPNTPDAIDPDATLRRLRESLEGISHGKVVQDEQSTAHILLLGITLTVCALFVLCVFTIMRH